LVYSEDAYYYYNFKALPLSEVTKIVESKSTSSLAGVVSIVVIAVFTSVVSSLLEIVKTVPFLGHVAAIALHLYEAVNQYLQNSKHYKR
jgi:hypothetical protein